MAAIGFLTVGPTFGVAADDEGSAVRAARYSTGQNGSRLKWTSQRPVAAVATEDAASSDCVTSSYESPRPVRTSQNAAPTAGAMNDPFGDKKSTSPGPTDAIEPKPLNTSPLPAAKPNGARSPLYTPKARSRPSPLGTRLEQEIPSRQHEFHEGCPSPKDLKKITEVTTNITPSEGDLPHDCPLAGAAFRGRNFAPITYTWTASGLCHKPLYFEDVQLERYGHMVGPWVQPFASGAHFFLTFPILPYKMGLELPNECIYTLGYYRPGDCAPYLFDPLPLSVRGALFEAGAWVGGVAMIP
ncbi:MAG: hypothetical protein ABFC77_11230 [Thermoguttaceae bacterium]